MFLGAGLVLSGCGDDDTATTPAPAPPPPPPPAPEPEPEPEPEPPATPTGLMVSATTVDSITWTWNAVEGAIGYAVQVSSDEMFDATDTIHPSAAATFTASPLPPETSVFVRVAAAGGTLEAPILSAWTTHVTGMSAMPPPPPPAPDPPGMPTGLMVSETTETSITWTWNAVDGATGYAVQVSSDEMFGDDDDVHNTEETTYTASDLDPSTSVYVRVAATSDAGMSGYTTHATGMSATPPPPPPLDPPGEPTGLAMSASNGTSITWSWDAVDGADGYQVQFNTVGNFAGVDAMHTAETSHTQMGLSEGMEGHLRVRATAGSGDMMRVSTWAAHVSGSTRVTPGIPMNLTATGGEGSITWTWDATENADSYYIQSSTSGAFTSTTESMEVMETSHTMADLEEGATAYLRVRASGGTGDQEKLMSGWADPTRGMTAVPAIPPAPTGLTATSGDGSITWSWDEVAGATGYQVQVSTSEDFSGAETTDVEGTSHAVDVDAGSTSYLRVRATGAGDPGAWSTHVTGMSNAPPEPEPEAPDPIDVSFSVGEDDGFPMEPDDSDDEEEATASVNAKMVVSSNYTAAITPMFVEGAAAVTVAAGDNNMPFAYVDWDAMQSDVVDGGAIFMVQKMAEGANQEMEPTGDVAYVACGPFECVSGDSADVTAPAITSADDDSYVAWEPVLDVSYGWVDNDVFDSDDGGMDSDDVLDDGIDLGWVTSSTLGMGVKHIFNGVPNGRNFSVTGPDAAGDKNAKATALALTREDDTDTADDDESFGITEYAAALAACIAADATGDDQPYGLMATGTGTVLTAGQEGLLRPDECFKIDAKPDWLGGYSLEFTPQNDGVAWGEVGWFDELEYESRTVAAADVVTDICELFEAEVDMVLEDEWTTDGFDVRGTDPVGGEGGDQNYVTNWKVGPGDISGRQFKTLWFDDDLDGDLKVKDTDKDPTPFMLKGANDLYNEAEVTTNVTQIWQTLIDDDNDLTSDFGKVDLEGALDDDADPPVPEGPDGEGDNMQGSQADEAECSMDDNGDDQEEACDSMIEMDFDIFFTDGTFGCETTRTVTVTCEWDSQGDLDGDETAATALNDTSIDAGSWAKCTAEAN